MTDQKSMSSRAWLALFALAFIWGGVFLSVHIALDEIGPFWAVAHRVTWAALILWIVVLAMRLPLPRDPKIWGALVVMGVLNNLLPFSLQAWAQLHIESSLTGILNAGTAVFGVLVAAIFLTDERLTTRKLIGVLLGFFGVATAIGIANLRSLDLRSLGQLAVIASTFCYAFAGVWARRRLVGLRPEIASVGMLTGSALVMFPIAWALEGPVDLSLTPRTWLAISHYAIVATAIAYLLYFRVLVLAGSGNATLCTLLVAPVAIVLGAVVLGESLPPNAYIGFGLIALGLIVIDGRLWKKMRR